jgi:hypothetical protein
MTRKRGVLAVVRSSSFRSGIPFLQERIHVAIR